MYQNIQVKIRSNYDLEALLTDGLKKCHKGKIWHLSLSFVKTKKDLNQLELFIKRAIVLLGENPANWEIQTELLAPLQKIFNLPESELFFSSQAQEVLCESAVLTPDRKTGFKEYRPDRIVVFKDKIVVVDFKSEKPMKRTIYNNYLAQIKKYSTLLREVFNRPVQSYLLFISEPEICRTNS
ncbi:MAG: hypothetical protein Q9M37_08240 [Desulfonauticus sp.]|nr:hypothetical protein [Desulfonauticus sp.]